MRDASRISRRMSASVRVVCSEANGSACLVNWSMVTASCSWLSCMVSSQGVPRLRWYDSRLGGAVHPLPVFSQSRGERMGKVFEGLEDGLRGFIAGQPMFFVATAPLSVDGHVNLSPKGLDTFRVLGPAEVAYLDLTGSGVETVAHLRENGRITLMFCA